MDLRARLKERFWYFMGAAVLSANVYHAARRLHKFRFSNMVAGFFPVHHRLNVVSQLIVVCAPMHTTGQIVVE
jgi:hypothetical protein